MKAPPTHAERGHVSAQYIGPVTVERRRRMDSRRSGDNNKGKMKQTLSSSLVIYILPASPAHLFGRLWTRATPAERGFPTRCSRVDKQAHKGTAAEVIKRGRAGGNTRRGLVHTLGKLTQAHLYVRVCESLQTTHCLPSQGSMCGRSGHLTTWIPLILTYHAETNEDNLSSFTRSLRALRKEQLANGVWLPCVSSRR